MAPALEVADIFRRHGEAFREAHAGHLGCVERRVMGAITTCRTAALGIEQCDDCGATRIAYNSCRNRHCPKCQGLARAHWLAERQAELLPVPYFHVVFTLPASVGEIAFQNKAAVYAILFRAAAETLATIAADPRHLGAKLGITMVLHTWGQTLQHHPHVHCVVPGGGPSLDGTHWVACRPGFFLPARVLSRLFRRLFLQELENAFAVGKLRFFSNLASLVEPQAFARRLGELRRLDWVVYAKPPFGSPEQVLAYLGRYTHRVAIANSRLLSLAAGSVRFTWKDYRQGGITKVMTLDADEFIRRFLLHALCALPVLETRPRAAHDQRTQSTYLFGAVCPERGAGAGLVLPACNTEAMQLHLDEIATKIIPGAHAIPLLDQAGWHGAKPLKVPSNISLLQLPPRAPELNGHENIWQFMRQNWLSNRIFKSFDDIVDHCCYAWNTLIDQP